MISSGSLLTLNLFWHLVTRIMYVWNVATIDGTRDGKIPKSMFETGLDNFFPIKAAQSMTLLKETLCNGADHVDIRELLMENAAGDQSPFIELVKKQNLSELVDFRKLIYQRMIDMAVKVRIIFEASELPTSSDFGI